METPARYLEIGFRSAAAGFHFDAAELIAAIGSDIQDADALEPVIPVLKYSGPKAQEHLDVLKQEFGIGSDTPVRSTTAYRNLLTDRVFARIEKLASLKEYDLAQRGQAAFYAGFGMGRFHGVFRAILLFKKLDGIKAVSASAPMESVPSQLHELAQEGARQLIIARKNEAVEAIHPWLDGLFQVAPPVGKSREELLSIDTRELQQGVQAIDEAIPAMRRKLARLH
jgi:hypothetical protein